MADPTTSGLPRVSSSQSQPTMESGSASSPSPRAAAGSREMRPSPSFQLTRRRSTQERINEILETGRSRAESMGATSGPASPRMQPLLRSNNVSSAMLSEHNAGYDDHLTMRQPSPRQPPNYQTVTPAVPTQSASAGTLRSRKPSSNRRQCSGSGQQRQGNDENVEIREEEDVEKWWLRAIKRFRSLELENKGSVARDHLALERTFLAWLRTSLSFASTGIAITQLFRLNTSVSDGTPNQTLRKIGKPLGTTFIAIGILMLFLGYRRYFQSQQYVIHGKFPASRGTIILVSLITLVITAASLAVLIAVQSPS